METDIPSEIEADRPSTITCPKCQAPMEKVKFQDIEIDRCTKCRGLWFDMLEREHLDALKGSATIDIGPAQKENRDKAVRINCPVCHTPMIRMVDLNNRNISYESCQVCYGLFYDAGEFREHKERHVFGFFRELFKRK
jgi:uncharacterized protein